MIIFAVFYADAKVVIQGKLIREHEIMPGEEYREDISLTNHGTIPAEVKIYQTDYTYSNRGCSLYPQPAGQTERSNANWINVNPSFLVIPPNETATIHCQVKIPLPSGDSLRGTYWSMLMIEEIQAADNSKKEDNIQHENITQPENELDQLFIGIHQVIRYGIQIVTNIGDTGGKEILILNQKIIPSKDRNNPGKLLGKEPFSLQLDIQNSGERWVQPVAYVEIYDQEGFLFEKFGGPKYVIYPGHSVRYQIHLDLFPHQSYQALVLLDNEDDTIWGAQYTLDL